MEEEDRGEEPTMHMGAYCRPLARLIGEENGRVAGSRRTTTTMRSYRTCGDEPKPAGATMPRPIVARTPFWLAALVVTTGIAPSGDFTEDKSCLPHSPSKIECDCGKETCSDKGLSVNQAPQGFCCKLGKMLEIKPKRVKGRIVV